MATSTYETNYVAHTGAAVAQINALIAANNALAAAAAKATAAVNATNAAHRRTATAAAAAQAATQGLGTATAALPAQTAAATSSIGGFGGSMLALRAGSFVVREVTAAIDLMAAAAEKAREFQTEGARKGLSSQDQAREYANLIGKDAPDDETMKQLFSLQRAGKFKNLGETLKYGEQFRGSSPAGLQKGNIGGGKRDGESQADYEKRVSPLMAAIEQEGALFANRVGLDPATGGDLAGSIGQYGKLPNVEAAAGQLGAMVYGLNEGRGKVSVLARGALGAAASLVNGEEGQEGRVKDMAEMGVIAGIASTSGAKTGAEAGTKVKQSDRFLKKLAGSKDADVAALGVKDDDTYLEALKKAAPMLTGPNARAWLRDHGFEAQTENDAAIGMAKNLPLFEPRLEKARKIADNGAEVMRQNRAFGDLSLTGQNRQAQGDKEIAEYLATEASQRLEVAREEAEGQLVKEGLNSWGSILKNNAMDAITYPFRAIGGDPGHRQVEIDRRAAENLLKEAEAAGIDTEKMFPDRNTHGSPLGMPLPEAFNKLAPELKAKGRGFIGDGGSVKAAVESMGGNAGGAAGPQASNDLKAVAGGIDKLVALTAETNKLLRTDGGGVGDFEPHNDRTDTFSNDRPGGMA